MRERKNIFFTAAVILFLVFFYFLFLSAPADFPAPATMRIEKGSSLRSISLLLENEGIIKSRAAFESFVIIFGGDKRIQYSDYLFEDALPVFEVAWRIAKGEHHIPPVSVTIPEGFDIHQIADACAVSLSSFDRKQFLLEAKDKEGYLFPDTYFFLRTSTEADVLNSMSENFNKKIAPLLPEVAKSGKSEKDIITMASVIEREAKGDEDRAVISGILWKRISIGMVLQVDAVPETYKITGLPKNPIGNPGLEAILASIHPQNSPYFYYLHDKNGTIHYAKTFEEHKQNEAKYLK
jgi:UPF0755 protein